MKKQYKTMVGSLLTVLIFSGFLFLGSQYLQRNQQQEQLTSELILPTLDLSTEHSYQFNAMTQQSFNVDVAQFNQEPLLKQIALFSSESATNSKRTTNWSLSKYQSVNNTYQAEQFQLIEQMGWNDFAWYSNNGATYLFRNQQPYTGWFSTAERENRFYNNGLLQLQLLEPKVIDDLIEAQWITQDLLAREIRQEIFHNLQPYPVYINNMSDVYPHILYKSSDNFIYTAPPGTANANVLTDTSNYVDMPMEVVKAVTTDEGEWLQVKIGYDQLGWIRKDPNYQQYVKTYYSEQALLDTIQKILEEEIATIDAIVGASFINNETMSQVDAVNQPFFPASTQKIYVMGEVYHQYALGTLSPDDTMTLYDAYKVPGAGIMASDAEGTIYTIDQLVDLVMIYSDNTAANMLIDMVGGGASITPWVQTIGLTDTDVDGKYYDETSEFVTSPHDAARYFSYLYNNRINGEPWDEMLINKFFQNTHNFLRRNIPSSTTAWNKSGLGYTEQNDVATFVTPYGSYSLAVYTSNPTDYDGIGDQLANLSLRVHDAFNEIRSQLWVTVTE
ncbi:class A beta-lactamase-related serine hydrolase [Aerococcaceae bacterium zg-BR22]|uniref:serine hydrolase n=1 Tax=Aerococcaceae bacterium zg-1292 TaxID=2774330 RepID=UPI00406458AC|nr:class A beta-lactamase-related serine hydrolase [Aerococcaceae bacterium zg-BR22]